MRDELGFDAAFDYHDGKVSKLLREAAPDGIDVYFDNVGGEHFAAAIHALRPRGRAALCGAISSYNDDAPAPFQLMQAIGKRLQLRGFIITRPRRPPPGLHRRGRPVGRRRPREVPRDDRRGRRRGRAAGLHRPAARRQHRQDAGEVLSAARAGTGPRRACAPRRAPAATRRGPRARPRVGRAPDRRRPGDAVVQGAARPPGAAARAEPVDQPVRARRGRCPRAARRRGAPVGTGTPRDVRCRDGVAELQIAESGEDGEPERAGERDDGERPLDPACGAPPARAAHPQVGARDRAGPGDPRARIVGGRRAAGQRGPGLGQAGGGLAGERADGGVDLRALDRRGGRERGARVFRGARPSPRRRSGSGRRRRSQAVHGTPAASAPRCLWARSTARTTPGQPGGVGERGDELLAVAPADAGGSALAGRGAQGADRPRRRRPPAAPARPGGCGRAPRPLRATRRCPRRCVRRARARARRRGRGRRARGADPCGRARLGPPSRSTWLSTTSIAAACPAKRAQVPSCQAASAYFCGSTTHTSRSTMRTRRSTSARCAASIESKSGRSSSTRPAGAPASSACRERTSSQSSRARVDVAARGRRSSSRSSVGARRCVRTRGRRAG